MTEERQYFIGQTIMHNTIIILRESMCYDIDVFIVRDRRSFIHFIVENNTLAVQQMISL